MDPTSNISILRKIEWNESFTGFLIRFGIITAIFLGILIAVLVSGFLNSTVDNWSRLRCSPLIMPFAEFFGYDSSENFNYCVRTMMQSQSGEFFQPIYAVLGQYSGSLGLVINTINGFRKALGNFKLSTDAFVGNVMAKIQSMIFQLRITFMRMMTLMNRVYGTMYSIIWMGTSALTAGISIGDNELVNFIFELCFAPDTTVRMLDGTLRTMDTLQIGDQLEGGQRITSVFRIKGDRTPMVRIGSDVVSGEHQVFCEETQEWIPARLHPAADSTDSLPLLICLNVEGHRFRTAAGLQVADYDESDQATTITSVKAMAEQHLNGGLVQETAPTAEYALGIESRAELWMESGEWIPLSEVQLGDKIYGGAEILGLVQEECPTTCLYEGLQMAAATLIHKGTLWERLESFLQPESTPSPTILHQVLTDRAGPLFLRNPDTLLHFCVRDYREAPLPDLETPYLETMTVQ